MLGTVYDLYSPRLYARVPPGRTVRGHGDYVAHALSLLSAVPDLAVRIDHQCALGSEEIGFRVATRWRLSGTHRGPGRYGPPSGRRVSLWGVSHHQIEEGKIVREHTAFDEFALLKQIHAPAAADEEPG